MATVQTPMISIASLKFLKPADLASILRQPERASKVTVVDVRDNDHVGGHIKGSQWVPIDQLDARIPELLRVNKDKDRVVFHCMLSQQRGPSAALRYARAKAYEVEKKRLDKNNEIEPEETHDGDDLNTTADGQEICVLEGGFEVWQSYYGDDEKLTDAYAKDIWE